MKIVVFSMTPLFPDRAMGGAQKQLRQVVVHLGALGHDVRVLCTRRHDAATPFVWAEGVRVEPVFRFKQPYPEPYATPIYNIADAIQDLGDALADADVFYSHDGGFVFPYVMQHVPTVTSLRSVLFSETLQAAFLFAHDALLLISQHQRATILNTVGRFFPGLAARTHVVHNGLDFAVFRASDPGPALAHIHATASAPVDAAQHTFVLYPHRPEAPKGIHEAIAVADALVHQHGHDGLRLLVPKWVDVGVSAEVRAFYEDLLAGIAARGLAEHVVFHDWVPEALMPSYYSLGAATLCLGSYVETFGNVPYESLACGTPAVLARVGPARDLLPDALVDKVDPGDVAAAAEVVARVLHTRERTRPATLTALHTHFRQEDQVAAYARIILGASKQPPLAYVPVPRTPATRYVLAPWCTQTRRGLYHDFRAEWHTGPLVALLGAHPHGLTETDAPPGVVRGLAEDGYLVPLQSASQAS